MSEETNFKLRDGYNGHNWHSGVVHACKPLWEQWSDVPESKRNLRDPQSWFYKTLCGSQGQYTLNLTTKREVTCLRCLKILKEEIDKEKLTQKTFDVWENKLDRYGHYNNKYDAPFGGMYKRKQIFKQL